MKQRKWFRRLISTALALSLTAGLSVPAAADAGTSQEDRSDVVPDPVLRALINQTLSTPEHPRNDGDPISAGDMALLTGSDAETIDAAEDGEVFALKGLCSDNLEYQNDASVDVNLSHGIQSLEGLQYAVNL